MNCAIAYRNKRKLVHAKISIVFAWIFSTIVWSPGIIGWQFISGNRTVPIDQCYVQVWVFYILISPGSQEHRRWTWPQSIWVNYLALEKIKLVTIQFINDSVGMSIATSAIAFYIPVGIMCILYSQVSVVEIFISSNWIWTLSVYTCVDIPTYAMNLSFIFKLRYIWLWKNEQKFYNLWTVSKTNWNKIFYQHNVIGKNRQKLPDHNSHRLRQWAHISKNEISPIFEWIPSTDLLFQQVIMETD